MSRGNHFQHKKKGHEPTIGTAPAEKKVFEKAEFAIEPVAKNGNPPVYIKKEKEQ
ncbi:hypothetical protein [Sutcliffiella halmapala]|uniref:hypothetical protein n=1 Tax=Sutcliffiella halmapala TaxID=79882 RepID=UPI001475E363|nr:hypothetical protein [Sutcliffiella halmapala]